MIEAAASAWTRLAAVSPPVTRAVRRERMLREAAVALSAADGVEALDEIVVRTIVALVPGERTRATVSRLQDGRMHPVAAAGWNADQVRGAVLDPGPADLLARMAALPVIELSPLEMDAIGMVRGPGVVSCFALGVRGEVSGMLTVRSPRRLAAVHRHAVEILASQTSLFMELLVRRESEQRSQREHWLARLVEHADELITVVDEQSIVRYQSPSSLQVLGRAADELVGRSIFDLCHTNDLDGARAFFDALLSAPGAAVPGHVRLRAADGRYRTIRGVGTNLVEADDVGGIVFTGHDATDEIALMRRLRRVEESFRVAEEVVQMGHWDLDLATGERNWSPQMFRLIGLDPADAPLPAGQWSERVHPDDVAVLDEAKKLLFERGESSAVEYRIRMSDGNWRTVVTRTRAKVGADGRPRWIYGTVRCVTEEREAEQRAARLEWMHALGNLARGIAHDFDDTLAVVAGHTDLVRRGIVDPEQRVASSLEAIERAIAHGSRLTRQVLSYSTPDGDDEPADCNEVIASLRDLLQPTLGSSHAILAELRSLEPFVGLDRGRLEQVVTNLVLNARDAMPDGGTVRVATETVLAADLPATASGLRPADAYLRLTVSDTGVGMDAETAADALTPGFTTKAGSSVGLGLAIAAGIVESAGGAISLHSVVGRGTTCEVVLPSLASRPDEPSPILPHVGALSRSHTVIVVDDNDDFRSALVDALRDFGCRTLATADGIGALELARSLAAVDLLLIDSSASARGDTVALLREAFPDIHVIRTSSQGRAQATEREIVLSKPFPFDQLRSLLRSLLEGEAARAEEPA